jgi:hypothetical protein
MVFASNVQRAALAQTPETISASVGLDQSPEDSVETAAAWARGWRGMARFPGSLYNYFFVPAHVNHKPSSPDIRRVENTTIRKLTVVSI